MRNTINRSHCTFALWGIVLSTALSGCGPALHEAAESRPSAALPAPQRPPDPAATSPSRGLAPSEPSAPADPATSRLWLWFVLDDGLAAVESDLPVGSSPDLVLRSLAVGPPSDQVAVGVRTVSRDPLTGQALASVSADQPQPFASASGPSERAATDPPAKVPVDGWGLVTVALSPAFSALPPLEQVLLLGQVVLSLAGSGAQMVAFTDEVGSPVAVPLPDGRLLDVPAVARDYSGLVIRP